MVQRRLFRGDDYGIRRALFQFRVGDVSGEPDPETGLLPPYDLAGCTVRSTWRPAAVPPDHAEGDDDAALHASITFDADGSVTASDGLVMPDGMTALDGTLLLVADRTVTATLPAGITLRGDVQTTDATGEVISQEIAETVTAIDLYTVTAP